MAIGYGIRQCKSILWICIPRFWLGATQISWKSKRIAPDCLPFFGCSRDALFVLWSITQCHRGFVIFRLVLHEINLNMKNLLIYRVCFVSDWLTNSFIHKIMPPFTSIYILELQQKVSICAMLVGRLHSYQNPFPPILLILSGNSLSFSLLMMLPQKSPSSHRNKILA